MTFPSRFEGFGAPVLEAMARRCPVIAADATATARGRRGRRMSRLTRQRRSVGARDDVSPQRRRLSARNLRNRASSARGEFTWGRAADVLEDSYRHALGTTL